MKKSILMILCSAVWLALASCQDDAVDVESGLNFAPTVFSVYPKTSVKNGTNFDVKVILVDGAGSPLSAATVILKDESGKELFNITKTIAGTKDSVVVAAKEFNSAGLPLGNYSLTINATDTRNNVNTVTGNFKVATQLYAANFDLINVIGQFADNWNTEKSRDMELIADNMWEVKGIDFKGGPWKFRNTKDWTGVDWGDADCDKVAAHGKEDVVCGYTGLVDVTFNDETFAYTIKPSVTYATKLKSLYLLGTMNNFEGVTPQFNLVADYTWEVPEVRIKPTDRFRFSELPGFAGSVYGAGANAGKAALQAAANIAMPQGNVDAYYKVSFNEQTLQYTLTVVRYLFPDNVFLVGGSSSAGWTAADAIPFVKTDNGKFEIYTYLKVVGDGVKFLQEKSFTGDWGKSKAAAGQLEQNDEDNVPVPVDGFYHVTVDFTTATYALTRTDWKITGSVLTGDNSGFTITEDMIFNGAHNSYTWTLNNIALKTGDMRFIANSATSDIRFGRDPDKAGGLKFNGSVIHVDTDGNYNITFTLDPVNGYTYSVQPSL